MSARSAIDARYTAILQTVGLNLDDLETMPIMTLKDRIATIDSSWRAELMKERKRIGQRKAQQRVRERNHFGSIFESCDNMIEMMKKNGDWDEN